MLGMWTRCSAHSPRHTTAIFASVATATVSAIILLLAVQQVCDRLRNPRKAARFESVDHL